VNLKKGYPLLFASPHTNTLIGENKRKRRGFTFIVISDTIMIVFRDLILRIIAGIIGIWLAAQFVPGVEIIDSWQTLIWAGLVLGLINYFVKPILNLITLPLRIITLGLFSLVINMGIIWLIDILFPEITIYGIVALFWATLIIWLLNLIIPKFIPKKKVVVEE